MLERRERELELVKAEYGDLEIGEKLDWVVITGAPCLPAGTKQKRQSLFWSHLVIQLHRRIIFIQIMTYVWIMAVCQVILPLIFPRLESHGSSFLIMLKERIGNRMQTYCKVITCLPL